MQHSVLQNTTIPGTLLNVRRVTIIHSSKVTCYRVIYIFSVYFWYVCPAKTQVTHFLRCVPSAHSKVSIRYNGESWYDKKKNSLSLCCRRSKIKRLLGIPAAILAPSKRSDSDASKSNTSVKGAHFLYDIRNNIYINQNATGCSHLTIS